MSLVGRHIGRYRILEQLGQGGMSVVYRGLDTSLDREVAVKVLHPHLATKSESRRRLEREAKAVARLKHPNILEVFDFAGESGDEAFIVTELIVGQTLRQFISTESLAPPEIAAMVTHELASALAHAHEAQVIHRDLKPENVMVRRDGVLKLMDFGIAKIIDRDEKMTMTGALVGSPAHMAPEIIEGEEAGAEADIFSLGTMLYLFATGKLPFTAANTTATLKKILDCNFEDPRMLQPTISDSLAQIITTCLQRAPSARYANAQKLKDALLDSLNEVGLSRPGEELLLFFVDPGTYRKSLTSRLVENLLVRAENMHHQKRVALAMSALNQVIAHEPKNVRALGLLNHMQARQAKSKHLRRIRNLALAVGGTLIVGASVARGFGTAVQNLALPVQAGEAEQNQGAALSSKAPPNGAERITTQNVNLLAAASDATTERTNRLPDETLAPSPLAVFPNVDAGAEQISVESKNVKSKIIEPTNRKIGKKSLDLVALSVLVRPFGYLKVDGKAVADEAKARFQLELSAGPHTFSVNCEECLENVVMREIAAGEELSLIAKLKPARVAFRGYPENAIVRLGGFEKSAGESMATPFDVATPSKGSLQMRHEVTFTVVQKDSEGQEAVIDGPRTVYVAPGKTEFVGRLP
jgi:serine/threonine protein kinase